VPEGALRRLLAQVLARAARRLTPLVCALLLCAWASHAAADAKVIVDLKAEDGSAVDGTVELKKGESSHRCTTQKGHCELSGVAGGLYSVEVSRAGKPSPKPKTVMIPPSGEVKLIVNAGP
jgi:hypothetical protein